MSKKPRGKPALMDRPDRPNHPRHKRVVKDEFRQCADPSGCNNIVSIQDQVFTDLVKVYCVLHRGKK